MSPVGRGVGNAAIALAMARDAGSIRVASDDGPGTPATATYFQSTTPDQAVASTTSPNAIRYQTNGRKSWRLT